MRGTWKMRAAVVALGATAAAGLLLPAAASRAPGAVAAEPPAPSLATRVLRDVNVRSGRRVRVQFRVDDAFAPDGATVAMSLNVERSTGEVVRVLVRGRQVAPGVVQEWRGRVSLSRGRYLLVAHARDAAGRAEAEAVPARLVVLRALPPLVPTGDGLRRALSWAAQRSGRVSVAVVDSRGRLHGYHPWRSFMSASVVKAMLLVAYLRSHPAPSPWMRDTLRRMIVFSDNCATDDVYGIVGRRALARLAKATGMRGFRPSDDWITTRVTAADMAGFFRVMERYIPVGQRRFADGLLTGITPSQCWGIPAAARPLGYRVSFKGGWLGAFVLASQAARLERRRARLGIAVFTDDNPAPGYGRDTIRGVTARLLRQ